MTHRPPIGNLHTAQPHMESKFRALFEAHHVSLLRLLHARGIEASEVEDVAMEIWKDIHRRLPDEAPLFDAVSDEVERRRRVAAWIAEFARNRAMRWRRDAGRRRVRVGEEAVTDAVDEGETPDAKLGAATRLAQAQAVLASLPEEQREVIEDLFFLDKSQVEAARERGWHESMLRRKLADALASAARAARRLGVQR